MRKTDIKKTGYSIILICEGIHTEPNFFGLLTDELIETEKADYIIEILPKPTISVADNELDLNRGGKTRQKRTPNNTTPQQQEVEKINLFPGEQPLNWVKGGITQLEAYNEVWVIFDKDGHPKTKEAFEEAERNEVEGKHVQIAFSSRCFEYYLLLHFELLYKAFEKSECNEKKYDRYGSASKTVCFHCMTDRAIPGKACHGEKCINGYARSKGYWKQSKDSGSTYPLVKDRLWTGICNAHTVRWKSNISDAEPDFYKRNPYIDVDRLTCRLMGYKTLESGEYYQKNDCCIKRNMDMITFTTEKGRTIIIPSVITIFNHLTGISRKYEQRIMLTTETPSQNIDLQKILQENEYCIFTIFSQPHFCTLLPPMHN